ncbi:unannotated protein [freshwater metagenome]|uniref:Unannotated protein n=1 Tax=freshwater metagenome TaxID=449393 RepID=A0A6J7H2R8_9ZZZZ|nr:2-oxo acid dehydrogenase subunit E2 [Actinomycetota bacterium]
MPEIVMPRLADAMEVGTLVRWIARAGAAVRRGDPLAEIEADKTTHTLDAEADGILSIVAQEGETLPVGAVLGTLETPAAEAAAPSAGAPRGTVTTIEPDRGEQQFARRVAEARATIPTITLRTTVDLELAEELLETSGAAAPGITDIIVKAAALALADHPRLNGAYRDARFEQFERVNVAVLMPGPGAPLAPTILDADRKGLAEIAAEARALAGRVAAGTLASPELAGGTFTVWPSPGAGVRSLEPFVTPGQAAALAAGEPEARPVARDGQVVVRRMLDLDLAVDHRVITAPDAAAFLARVRAILEAPLTLTI